MTLGSIEVAVKVLRVDLKVPRTHWPIELLGKAVKTNDISITPSEGKYSDLYKSLVKEQWSIRSEGV